MGLITEQPDLFGSKFTNPEGWESYGITRQLLNVYPFKPRFVDGKLYLGKKLVALCDKEGYLIENSITINGKIDWTIVIIPKQMNVRMTKEEIEFNKFVEAAKAKTKEMKTTTWDLLRELKVDLKAPLD